MGYFSNGTHGDLYVERGVPSEADRVKEDVLAIIEGHGEQWENAAVTCALGEIACSFRQEWNMPKEATDGK